jgi:hypothetical protein
MNPDNISTPSEVLALLRAAVEAFKALPPEARHGNSRCKQHRRPPRCWNMDRGACFVGPAFPVWAR